MKKKYLIYMLLSFVVLTGCSVDTLKSDNLQNKNTTEILHSSTTDTVEDTENNEQEDLPENTIFNGLGTTYSGSKKISDLEYKAEICNYNNYVRGEYKEVDFAIDLIYKLLLGDKSVYNNIISLDEFGNIIDLTDSDRNEIENNLRSLKVDQLGIDENSELYFNFVSAQYYGENGEGCKIYIRGNIGAPLTSYFVTVYEKDNTLMAQIK